MLERVLDLEAWRICNSRCHDDPWWILVEWVPFNDHDMPCRNGVHPPLWPKAKWAAWGWTMVNFMCFHKVFWEEKTFFCAHTKTKQKLEVCWIVSAGDRRTWASQGRGIHPGIGDFPGLFWVKTMGKNPWFLFVTGTHWVHQSVAKRGEWRTNAHP